MANARPDLDALQALLDKNPHDGTDAAQADAARYRWLRGQMVHEHYGPLLGWTIGTLLPGDDPDAAIDAAMKGEGDA